MKTTYKYLSSSLSRDMTAAVTEHLHQIGRVESVSGWFAGKNPWYRVVVKGAAGRLVLRGCSWGYGGEGPHATLAVLRLLDVHPFDADRIAFQAPPLPDDVQQQLVWRVYLPSTCAQLSPGRWVSEPVEREWGGQDRQYKVCRCARCGVTAQCTPDFDFYVPDNAVYSRRSELVCEPCLLELGGLAGKPVVVIGANPQN